MHVLAVLNRDGGSLRDRDTPALAERIEAIFRAAGHTIETRPVAGEDIAAAMREAAADRQAQVLLAGGGDGTISLAAGLLAHTDKALAVLPAGTMNLFARALRIPLDLETAAEALARGTVRKVDIARAGERYFVHQFSIGMHPHLIDLRERMEFRTRFGKMTASGRAALATFVHPPSLKVTLEMGGTEILAATSSLVVTNNLYGEGQSLPVAARPDGGRLGIYITRARRRGDLVRLFWRMGFGRWRDNPHVEIHEATSVTVRIRSPRRKFQCAVDGELRPLEGETAIALHAGALDVLAPASEEA